MRGIFLLLLQIYLFLYLKFVHILQTFLAFKKTTAASSSIF